MVKKIVAAIGSNKKSKRFFALCRKNEGKALEISRRQKNKIVVSVVRKSATVINHSS